MPGRLPGPGIFQFQSGRCTKNQNCKYFQRVSYALLLPQQILSFFHYGKVCLHLTLHLLLPLHSMSLDKHFLTFPSPSVSALHLLVFLVYCVSMIPNLISYLWLLVPLLPPPPYKLLNSYYVLNSTLHILHIYLFTSHFWAPIISHLTMAWDQR